MAGSGIAGLSAALAAADAGAEVTIATKASLEDSATGFAQGGIAAVTGADDSIAAHLADTLTAGAGHADPAAARILVSEGPDRVSDLIALGTRFDRDTDGALRRGREAAHSAPRVLHAGGDATGAEIERALARAVRAHPAVAVLEDALLVDLVVDRGTVTGALVQIAANAELIEFPADAVLLATGGAGQLFSHTTNPGVSTGDGIAVALRAGAAVADLEFVQFHPTVLAHEVPFLVSEAVRGEGAILLDEHGRRFTLDAHPDAELAPRDIVARAITEAMRTQGGRPVFLDATAVASSDQESRAAYLARRFPTIDRELRSRGIDWASEPVPVHPAAHYLMGGVATDLEGRTSLPGLFAAGETACTGVHGANRLASNSLLEGAVFGTRAGRVAATTIPTAATLTSTSRPVATRRNRSVSPAAPPTAFSRAGLQELMWREVGLVRDHAGLTRAADQLTAWRGESRSPATRAEREDAALVEVATAMVDAALARTQSLGAHSRADSPLALAEAS
ncbi:L-aspartate oxidase [Microbacterium sediminicola]|uniref:L-aspartate oxidase n=1 Tax=Microbacterium sediminicola TaxID=415210 RepID=A0ABN2I1U9_9MICO